MRRWPTSVRGARCDAGRASDLNQLPSSRAALRRRSDRRTVTRSPLFSASILPNLAGIRWHWRGVAGTGTIAEFACAAAVSGGEPSPVAWLRMFTQRHSSPLHLEWVNNLKGQRIRQRSRAVFRRRPLHLPRGHGLSLCARQIVDYSANAASGLRRLSQAPSRSPTCTAV